MVTLRHVHTGCVLPFSSSFPSFLALFPSSISSLSASRRAPSVQVLAPATHAAPNHADVQYCTRTCIRSTLPVVGHTRDTYSNLPSNLLLITCDAYHDASCVVLMFSIPFFMFILVYWRTWAQLSTLNKLYCSLSASRTNARVYAVAQLHMQLSVMLNSV
ncbi:hypothetical protein CALVIDRAFT_116321 [Calocera viscosa TUFC12733]|uniref:Uncharacterized protein n=1 Tax=Calocera viscosa (strain TUFC12733) TaxID=1330018 RepID=A0A167M7T0_CALVF|nr:hypothetical protein CALVIDRAFT_116321 [Calocera viscosa TUFC12733]